MSDEVKQYRDLRTTEQCTLVSKEVALPDGSKVGVPYVVYARGHERALETSEEKNFEEIKPVKPLAAGEAEASEVSDEAQPEHPETDNVEGEA